MYGVSASEVPEISVDELRRVDAWSWIMIFWVVVSSICRVHPYLGKIPILTNIFQMGLKPPTRLCVIFVLIFKKSWKLIASKNPFEDFGGMESWEILEGFLQWIFGSLYGGQSSHFLHLQTFKWCFLMMESHLSKSKKWKNCLGWWQVINRNPRYTDDPKYRRLTAERCFS